MKKIIIILLSLIVLFGASFSIWLTLTRETNFNLITNDGKEFVLIIKHTKCDIVSKVLYVDYNSNFIDENNTFLRTYLKENLSNDYLKIYEVEIYPKLDNYESNPNSDNAIWWLIATS